jgi:hypothetical protein
VHIVQFELAQRPNLKEVDVRYLSQARVRNRIEAVQRAQRSGLLV